MSMLAETKKREKWSLNPRGKLWSADTNKFGQRLMEKMGWSSGQGLGVNNQGPTDLINVKMKGDNKGLGFKDNSEEWLKTTNQYNELLDHLKNNSDERDTNLSESSLSYSLEDRSKKSKARVHYHKFARGKDLSKYSVKDLASIIGPDLVRPEDQSEEGGPKNQVNMGSSTNYFENKKKERESNFDLSIEEESQTKKSHKKSKRTIELNKSPDEDVQVQLNCESNMSCVNGKAKNDDCTYKAKKKKNKRNSDEITCVKVSFDETDENVVGVSKIETFDTPDIFEATNKIYSDFSVSQSLSPLKKSSKKRKLNCNNGDIEMENVSSNFEGGTEVHPLENKKRKKKSKHSFQEPNCDKNLLDSSKKEESIEKLNSIECDANNFVRKEKKSKRNKVNNEIGISEAVQEQQMLETNCSNEDVNGNDGNISLTRKEKSSKKRKLVGDEEEIMKSKNNPTHYPSTNESHSPEKKRKSNKNFKEPSEQSSTKSLSSNTEGSNKLEEKKSRKTKLKNKLMACSLQEQQSFETQSTIEEDDSSYCANQPPELKNISSIEVNTFKRFSHEERIGIKDSFSTSVITNQRLKSKNDKCVPKKETGPNKDDYSASLLAILYAHSLVKKVLKELNINQPNETTLKQNNCTTLNRSESKKLRLICKTEEMKKLLPSKMLVQVENQIKQFCKRGQHKKNLFEKLLEIEKQICFSLLEIENQISQISQEFDSTKLNSNIREAITNVSSQLESLKSKCKESTKQDHEKKNSTLNTQKNRKFEHKTLTQNKTGTEEQMIHKCLHIGTLQNKINEKSNSIIDQINLLLSGKVDFIKGDKIWVKPKDSFNEDSYSGYQGDTSVRKGTAQNEPSQSRLQEDPAFNQILRKRGGSSFPTSARFEPSQQFETTREFASTYSQRGFGNRRGGIRGSLSFRGQVCKTARGAFEKGHFGGKRGFSRGRGVLRGQRGMEFKHRGRISQNNFDAKQYAEKCKAENKVPELGFKGVDLKVISGYATNTTGDS